MRMFTPVDNDDSNIQIGTQRIPFPRKNNGTFQWVWGLPYVKYGYGAYNPETEFVSQGLYGTGSNSGIKIIKPLFIGGLALLAIGVGIKLLKK